MSATLESVCARIDVWEGIVRDAEARIAELSVDRVRAIAADRHPAARSLHLHHDAEGYFTTGIYAADGRDLIDGVDLVDGVNLDTALTEAVSALPSGAVAYDPECDAHRIELPGGPPRCTVCGRTEDEDDSCPDDIYGRHNFH